MADAIEVRSKDWRPRDSTRLKLQRPRTMVSCLRSWWWNVTPRGRHLAKVTESFYDREWRRECRGGEYPESHLWSAAAAYLELDAAASNLE